MLLVSTAAFDVKEGTGRGFSSAYQTRCSQGNAAVREARVCYYRCLDDVRETELPVGDNKHGLNISTIFRTRPPIPYPAIRISRFFFVFLVCFSFVALFVFLFFV